jgi:hypothetical protein
MRAYRTRSPMRCAAITGVRAAWTISVLTDPNRVPAKPPQPWAADDHELGRLRLVEQMMRTHAFQGSMRKKVTSPLMPLSFCE